MAIVVSVTGRWQPVIDALRNRAVVTRIGLASLLLTINWTTYVWAVVNDRVIETALGYFLAPLGTMALGVFAAGRTPDAAQAGVDRRRRRRRWRC